MGAATLGVLMDLRDELKLLNHRLARFEQVSIAIRRNTAWSRKTKSSSEVK
jgi:hypothetical protein